MNDTSPSTDERTWAAAAHLTLLLNLMNICIGLIGSIVVYVLSRNRGPFARDQAREALNFQLTVMLVMVALLLAVIIVIAQGPLFMIIGGGRSSLLWLTMAFVLATLASAAAGVVAAMQANRGERFRYPFAIRFVR
jgi:hypothetical protein